MEEANFVPYPEEIKTIKGETVIVEDYTEDGRVYSFATFLIGDQFIVLEGTVSVDEISKIVESLLS